MGSQNEGVLNPSPSFLPVPHRGLYLGGIHQPPDIGSMPVQPNCKMLRESVAVLAPIRDFVGATAFRVPHLQSGELPAVILQDPCTTNLCWRSFFCSLILIRIFHGIYCTTDISLWYSPY